MSIPGASDVLAYLRRTNDAAVLVLLNMSTSIPNLRDVLAGTGLQAKLGRVLAATMRSENATVPVDAITLRPLEVLIVEIPR